MAVPPSQGIAASPERSRQSPFPMAQEAHRAQTDSNPKCRMATAQDMAGADHGHQAVGGNDTIRGEKRVLKCWCYLLFFRVKFFFCFLSSHYKGRSSAESFFL